MIDQKTYEKIVDDDIENLWLVQEYFEANPKLEEWMTAIVSKHPWYDICSLIWYIAAIGWLEIGWKHFWVVSANLLVAFVARKLIQAKRPVEYDLRLQPTSDLGADSYGFPSLETYMAVVITGHFVLHFHSFLMFPFALAVVCVIGVSRLYTKSRFPHQIFGSAILGAIGLLMGLQWCDMSSIHLWDDFPHGTAVSFVIMSVIVVFAFNMENNDSRLLYVPKKEFVQVMSGIINGSSEANGEATDPRSRREKDSNSYGDQNYYMSHPARDRVVKRDSFYFLQRTLESRAAAKKKNPESHGSSDTPTSRLSAAGSSASRAKDGKLTTRLNNIM